MSGDQPPVGAAMWGDRPLPRMPEVNATPPIPEQDPEGPYPPRVSVRDATSLVLITVGDVLTVLGVGLRWGGDAAVIAAGISLMALGVLIGVAT